MKVAAKKSAPARAPVASPKSTPAAASAPAAAKGWSRASTAVAGPKGDGFGVARARPSQAALTGVASGPAQAFGGQSFEAQLDQDTKSRAVTGNKVTMLFDGVSSFAERSKMIDGAKSSICMQTFIFNSDDTGWALARQLADKAKQGVKVRVIYDAVGSGRADPKMFELMQEAGVELKDYGPKWQLHTLNERWHEKHLIVDGKASIEGGMNIANEYALGGSGKMVFSRGEQGTEAWRDTDAKLEGPAVNDATRAFLRNWEALDGLVSEAERAALLPTIAPVAGGGTSVRVVQNNPRVEGLEGTADKLYLDAIKAAKKSITIENAYLLPPEDLRVALIDAAKRGVAVRIMTNSRESNDMGAVADASRYFYDELIKAGVQIFEKQGGTLHAKTATFDGQYSIVGSVNLNGRSATLDAEDALGIQGAETAQKLEARFQGGLTSVRAVTLEELDHEDLTTNLKQWALHTFAWTM